jgi:PAS domain S-box-containing protein
MLSKTAIAHHRLYAWALTRRLHASHPPALRQPAIMGKFTPPSNVLPDYEVAYEPATNTSIRWERLASLTQDPMIKQLSDKMSREMPLPQSLRQALVDIRPIVVTSASPPFKIINVNSAWENMCGYKRDEAMNKGLGSLLHGSETEFEVAKCMVEKLMKGKKYSEAVLTNYTKEGRKFQNLVRLKPLCDNGEHCFVGVLREIPNNLSQENAMTMH